MLLANMPSFFASVGRGLCWTLRGDMMFPSEALRVQEYRNSLGALSTAAGNLTEALRSTPDFTAISQHNAKMQLDIREILSGAKNERPLMDHVTSLFGSMSVFNNVVAASKNIQETSRQSGLEQLYKNFTDEYGRVRMAIDHASHIFMATPWFNRAALIMSVAAQILAVGAIVYIAS